MHVTIESPYRLHSELRRQPDIKEVPLSSLDVTPEAADLVEEAWIAGVLADVLPESAESVRARIEPVFSDEPLVERIKVHLQAGRNGSAAEYSAEFKGGRWNRTEKRRLIQLREEGTLGENESAYRMLVALPAGKAPDMEPPVLQSPPIVDGTLEQFGFRETGTGEFVPDRPILINQRLETDSVAACVAAGSRETGGAALGAFVRLPEPLPHTSTRIVTLLTTCLEDRRHSGKVNEWSISPEALAESAQIAQMRGLGETVLTVIHTHGWSTECGKCNENANCPLAECTLVSLLDYQVLETLFPGKATVMPIAGRKLGAPGKQPVLEVHAWRGGEMRPMRWMRYVD